MLSVSQFLTPASSVRPRFPVLLKWVDRFHIYGTGSSIVDTVFVCRSHGAVRRGHIFHTSAELIEIVRNRVRPASHGRHEADLGGYSLHRLWTSDSYGYLESSKSWDTGALTIRASCTFRRDRSLSVCNPQVVIDSPRPYGGPRRRCGCRIDLFLRKRGSICRSLLKSLLISCRQIWIPTSMRFSTHCGPNFSRCLRARDSLNIRCLSRDTKL